MRFAIQKAVLGSLLGTPSALLALAMRREATASAAPCRASTAWRDWLSGAARGVPGVWGRVCGERGRKVHDRHEKWKPSGFGGVERGGQGVSMEAASRAAPCRAFTAWQGTHYLGQPGGCLGLEGRCGGGVRCMVCMNSGCARSMRGEIWGSIHKQQHNAHDAWWLKTPALNGSQAISIL